MKDLPAPTHIAASLLHIAPENPRSEESVDYDRIEVLAENIRAQGVLTPIIGYMNDHNFFAVAGGRRTRAIRLLLDRGSIAPEYEVPVTVIDYSRALEIGIAEQITHQNLSPIDELRIYAHEQFKHRSDAELAKLIGRSEKAVRQRRAVLSLPQDVLDATFAGEITVDQAHGLTYFLGDDDSISELLEDCKNNRRITLGDLRAQFERQCGEWSNNALTSLVTQEEYTNAGGKLQSDLFTDSAFILSPHILRDLAREKAEATVRKDYSEWGFIREKQEDEDSWPKRHRGCDNLTDEEREEWEDIRYEKWQHDEEEEPDWFARYEELEGKAERFYPPELKALLGVRWELSRWNRDQPIIIDEGILPEDLEPLYEGGWLDRPEEGSDTPGTTGSGTPDPEQPRLTTALQEDIERIKLHVARQELAKAPNRVIMLYLQHVNTQYSYKFSHTPEAPYQPPAMELGTSGQFDAMMKMDATDPGDIPAMSAGEQRKLLAFKMLKCMTTSFDASEFEGDIRKYLTPDADFLKRYKKPLLVQMAAEAFEKPESEFATQKVAGLASIMADYAASHPHWLPVGFS